MVQGEDEEPALAPEGEPRGLAEMRPHQGDVPGAVADLGGRQGVEQALLVDREAGAVQRAEARRPVGLGGQAAAHAVEAAGRGTGALEAEGEAEAAGQALGRARPRGRRRLAERPDDELLGEAELAQSVTAFRQGSKANRRLLKLE